MLWADFSSESPVLPHTILDLYKIFFYSFANISCSSFLLLSYNWMRSRNKISFFHTHLLYSPQEQQNICSRELPHLVFATVGLTGFNFQKWPPLNNCSPWTAYNQWSLPAFHCSQKICSTSVPFLQFCLSKVLMRGLLLFF